MQKLFEHDEKSGKRWLWRKKIEIGDAKKIEILLENRNFDKKTKILFKNWNFVQALFFCFDSKRYVERVPDVIKMRDICFNVEMVAYQCLFTKFLQI